MACLTTRGRRSQQGFTLIELMVVMAIIAVLTTFVAPGYLKQSDRAKETVLRHNLSAIRGAIDAYRADRGSDPESIDTLVQNRYLREIPMDPITGKRDSWTFVPGTEGGFRDVASGASGRGLDGQAYDAW